MATTANKNKMQTTTAADRDTDGADGGDGDDGGDERREG